MKKILIVTILVLLALFISSCEKNVVGQASAAEPDRCVKGCVTNAVEAQHALTADVASTAKSLSIPYMDPTRCPLSIFNITYDAVTIVDCGANRFVGLVTHFGCKFTDNIVIVGTGWYGNTLPTQIQYSCVDSAGNLYAPPYIYAYCCEIPAPPTPPPTKSSISVDKSGKITQT